MRRTTHIVRALAAVGALGALAAPIAAHAQTYRTYQEATSRSTGVVGVAVPTDAAMLGARGPTGLTSHVAVDASRNIMVAGAPGAADVETDIQEWGSVVVDAAAAVTDNRAAPTAVPLVASIIHVWDGATYDRLYGDSANGADVDVTRMPATAADGAALPALTVVVAGSDGANAQALSTDANGELQVDVLTLPGGLTGYAEDSAHSSGHIGIMGLSVRSDVKASTAGATGDYAATVQDADGDTYVSDTVAQTSLAAIEASASVVDDWDDGANRANVNIVVGQAGVTAGAGAVAANTQRTTLASDDPAVTSLAILDDWDETNRAAVNLVAGQAGITAGAGAVAANTPRVTHASDDPAVALLTTIDADTGAINTATASLDTKAIADDGDDLDSGAGTDTVRVGGIAVAAAGGHVAITGDVANGLDVDVTRSALPAGAATEVTLAAAAASLSVLDDWDETDRAKVNPIAGQAGVAAGAGASDALTQRVTLASNDPAVALLTTIDADTGSLDTKVTVADYDSGVGTDNAIEAGLTLTASGGAHHVAVGQQARTASVPATLSTEDQATADAAAASLSVVDDWDETNRAAVNTIAGQVGVQGAAGAATALTQRVTVATDDVVSVDDNGASLTVDAPVGTPAFVRLSDGAAAQGTAAAPLFVRTSDGTDQVLVTAAGELNVIATAQPGVDIGDVTVNNAAGASAVNVQDGGNSLTVDAPVGTPAAFRLSDGSAFEEFDTQDLDSGGGTASRVAVGIVVAGAGAPVAITGDAANGIDVDVTRSALPTGAATETSVAAAAASLAAIDDWDETDRAKVNPIAGQAGVAAGAGAVDALTQRVTLASNDPAVALLGTIDADTGAISTAAQSLDTKATTYDADTGAGTDTVPEAGLTLGASGGAHHVAIGQQAETASVPVTLSVENENTINDFSNKFPNAAVVADNYADPGVSKIATFGMLYDGANWDMARGTSADGALVNLGTNNDVTVTTMPATVADGGALPAVQVVVAGYDGSVAQAMKVAADGAVATDVETYPGPSAAQVPAALGQTTMAGSLAVVLASNQTAVPASQSGAWTVINQDAGYVTPTVFTLACDGTEDALPNTAGRDRLVFTNSGTVDATIGLTGVVAGTGMIIGSGQTFDLPLGSVALYCRTAGTSVTLSGSEWSY